MTIRRSKYLTINQLVAACCLQIYPNHYEELIPPEGILRDTLLVTLNSLSLIVYHLQRLWNRYASRPNRILRDTFMMSGTLNHRSSLTEAWE